MSVPPESAASDKGFSLPTVRCSRDEHGLIVKKLNKLPRGKIFGIGRTRTKIYLFAQQGPGKASKARPGRIRPSHRASFCGIGSSTGIAIRKQAVTSMAICIRPGAAARNHEFRLCGF